jgi:hypothetical protein
MAYSVDGKMYKDPIQGTINNCAFIAGIASIAWAQPNLIPEISEIVNNVKYWKFKFYPNVGAAYGTIRATENILPGGASSSDAGEFWPALYEKAYAGWYLAGRPGAGTTTNIDLPNLANASWSNAELIMQYLTGKDYTDTNVSTIGVNNIRNWINQRLPQSKPMIMRTYQNAPAGVVYADNIIRRDHAYSVLCVHPTQVNYVLLRNPYGPVSGDPADNNITYRQGNVALPGKPVIDLTNTGDGVFALNIATINTHFEKITWTNAAF